LVKFFIDAKDSVAGRVASFAAKQAINGDEVIIINAAQAVMSGNRKYLLDRYHQRISRGTPTTGPFYPRTARGVMKRIIRGMLPYKEERGRKAFKRVKVFDETPKEYEHNTFDVVTKTKHDFMHNNYVTLKELTIVMGKAR